MSSAAKWAGVLGAALALEAIAGGLLHADVVHLANGRTLEGVVMEDAPHRVRLRLPFGELSLSRSSVRAVERSATPLGEFLERWRDLTARRAAAEEWLELALWARAEGLAHNAAEAAQRAARLEPRLAGLAPLMRDIDYVFDDAAERWIPYQDFMHQRGLVWLDGQWLPRSEVEARRRAEAEAEHARREREQQEQLTRVMEMMLMRELLEGLERRELTRGFAVSGVGLPVYWGLSVASLPGVGLEPGKSRVPAPSAAPPGDLERRRQAHQRALLRRPPGSLIPVTARGQHRGGISAAPDSR